MSFSIRNFIIFVGIAGVLFSIYVYFTGNEEPEESLITTQSATSTSLGSSIPGTPGVTTVGQQNQIAQDFLILLLNARNIKLDDSIFLDNVFNNLRDSSIILIPDGNEGRPNPFAQFGADISELPPNVVNTPASVIDADTTP